MKQIALSLSGPTYRLPDARVDAQSTVNFYPETVESGVGKVATYLRPTPGLSSYATAGAGPVRAMTRTSTGVVLCVSGTTLYRLDGSITTAIATLTTGGGRLSFADNGRVVLLVDGTQNALCYDLTTGVVTTIALPIVADQIVCACNYFVLKEKDTARFFVSDAGGTTFNALSFATAEGSPDPLIAIAAAGRELWLFGQDSTEVWSPSGTADFPFMRLSGVFIEQGAASPDAVAVLAGAVYWLGRGREGQGVVWRSNVYAPERVSTHAVEAMLSRMPRIGDGVAMAYLMDGHAFLCLTFPTAEATLCFDAATSMWHERASRLPYSGKVSYWRPSCLLAVEGQILAGDRYSGAIFKLDQNATTDAGDPIIRRRVLPYVASAGRLTTHHALTFDLTVGTGQAGAMTQSPRIMLRYSDDGGMLWSPERWADTGSIGMYRPRVRFTRLGASRHRLYEVAYADPCIVNLISATLEVS